MKCQRLYFRGTNAITTFFGFLIALFLQVPTASAIPSYARQTGFPCKSCHYMPPELTPLGRAFKLQAEWLHSGDEADDLFEAQRKARGRAGHLRIVPLFGVVRYFLYLHKIACAGLSERQL
jgi:hypothetical protein